MHGRCGISGYMLLAAAFVLSKSTGTISEYINRPPRDWDAPVPGVRGSGFLPDDESTEVEREKNQ